LRVEQQRGLKVIYDGVVVGDFFADLLVEGCVLLELKAVQALHEAHFAQCLNYLKATGLQICLLINLGKPRVKIKRLIHDV
jgi:GxxExxY protein